MRIAMIGSGYVGLVSGACLADFGHDVICVDKDLRKIESLKAGQLPIYEPGLSDLVSGNVHARRLSFTTEVAASVAEADIVFIAVGTPARRGDGYADLSYVYGAAREVAGAVRRDAVIVTKSTVPVGTGDEVERIVRDLRPGSQIAVASNPEFLREGAAIADFKHPDRIVIGTSNPRAAEVMEEVYRPLYLNKAPILQTSRRTAELIKYAANAMLATKIAFINEIADLCERAGADVQDVARGIGMDGRIGGRFLNAGPGYGGSCFPKDTLALIKTAQDHDAPLRIVESVAASNANRKRAMGRKIIAACGGNVRGRCIALLGLTFKPDTDDMRDSPALDIVAALHDAGARVRAFDPEGMPHARSLLPEIEYAADPYSCIDGADGLAIVTEWDAFRALDLARVAQLLRGKVLIDLRNIYSAAEAARYGLTYVSVGRSGTNSEEAASLGPITAIAAE